MTGSRDTKHHKKDSSSESSSSSSSSSSSELECFSNDNEHTYKHQRSHRHKHHKHNKSDSECSDKSKSDCKPKPKFKLCDIYNYFRNRLLEDEQLMIAGSTAYFGTSNNVSEIVPNNHALKFNNNIIMFNIDRFNDASPFYVRESGVYIFFICANTDSSAQFTFFINGVVNPYTCIGTNSGAGQVVSRHMLELNKNDNVIVRNYISSSVSVALNVGMGGLQVGNSAVAIGFKMSPLNPANVNPENECKFMESLSHKKKKLFKKLTEKILCDNTLMPKGFNTHGTFYTKSTQIINTETDVVFDLNSVVEGLYWDPLNPSQVKILQDGYYKLFFLVTTNTAAQFSLSVNGVPIEYTTQGINRGAGQLTTRSILELKQGDIVTVKNHTSANGSVVISEYAGGKYQSTSAILTIFKLAPLQKSQPVQVDCKLAKHYECYYHLFRDYLLYHHFLQIAGTKSYFSVTTSVPQEILVGDSVHWANKILCKNTNFIQGENVVTIKEDGIYDLFADVITDEPSQLTLFINGVPNYATTFGRDSGASRCLIRQFIPLKVNDQISVVNWESHSGKIHTAENSGGNYPAQNSLLMGFMLSPLCEPPQNPPSPPVQQNPPSQPVPQNHKSQNESKPKKGK
jgi:hypothetical protein